eukprot:COSAG01_NODE_176_length_22957_cov_72.262096_4_plen_281_part_00
MEESSGSSEEEELFQATSGAGEAVENVGALRRRAGNDGVAQVAIEAAQEGDDDPKVELIELIAGQAEHKHAEESQTAEEGGGEGFPEQMVVIPATSHEEQRDGEMEPEPELELDCTFGALAEGVPGTSMCGVPPMGVANFNRMESTRKIAHALIECAEKVCDIEERRTESTSSSASIRKIANGMKDVATIREKQLRVPAIPRKLCYTVNDFLFLFTRVLSVCLAGCGIRNRQEWKEHDHQCATWRRVAAFWHHNYHGKHNGDWTDKERGGKGACVAASRW